ncbi:histone-lysine N-methyltransferase SETMAR [Trichonephila clavipes]|nr:histone-lysine N-methyltransferase SETMAR [Trichonephila clavipes]
MAASIQNPAKSEVRSVIRFLHGEGRPSVISDALLQRTEEAIRALGHHISGKSFQDDDEIKDEVEMWFRQQAATFYDCGIQKLVHRLNKYLNNGGHYVEK